jgi:hypothetical protein
MKEDYTMTKKFDFEQAAGTPSALIYPKGAADFFHRPGDSNNAAGVFRDFCVDKKGCSGSFEA